jgi:predicted amidophosphoribosyltransferase
VPAEPDYATLGDMSAALAVAARALLDLALPVACAGCGEPATTLCSACGAALRGAPRVAWPDPAPPDLPTPYAVAPYADVVRALIVAHKERGARPLAAPLGAALACSVDAAVAALAGGAGPAGRPVALVPMPSRRAALRARGHDPTLAMARRAARALRRRGRQVLVCPVLRLRPGVGDQAGLDAGARRANLAGAVLLVRAGPRLLQGATVLLVDDVITTGSSLAAAAATLRASGADVPAAAVVAATQRHVGAPALCGPARWD